MILRTIITISFCILLVGCQPVQSDKTITIGGLFALTGSASVWGSAERDAVALAFEEANAAGGINGRKIVLVAEDTQTEPEKAVTAYQKLVTVNRLDVIIGPTWEDSASAVVPLATRDKILLLSPSSYQTIEIENSTRMFATYSPFRYQIAAFAPLFTMLNATRFVIVYNDAVYPKTMADLFIEEARIHNWTIVTTLHAPIGTNDYRTMILQIHEHQSIDGVYILLWDPDLGLFFKQAYELGVNFTAYGVEADENNNLLHNYGTYMENLIYPFPNESPQYRIFEATYESRYGKKPASSSAAAAYDAANLLIVALRSGATTPDAIAAYLHNNIEYEGASGPITFDEHGIIGEKAYSMKTIRNGTFVTYMK